MVNSRRKAKSATESRKDSRAGGAWLQFTRSPGKGFEFRRSRGTAPTTPADPSSPPPRSRNRRRKAGRGRGLKLVPQPSPSSTPSKEPGREPVRPSPRPRPRPRPRPGTWERSGRLAAPPHRDRDSPVCPERPSLTPLLQASGHTLTRLLELWLRGQLFHNGVRPVKSGRKRPRWETQPTPHSLSRVFPKPLRSWHINKDGGDAEAGPVTAEGAGAPWRNQSTQRGRGDAAHLEVLGNLSAVGGAGGAHLPPRRPGGPAPHSTGLGTPRPRDLESRLSCPLVLCFLLNAPPEPRRLFLSAGHSCWLLLLLTLWPAWVRDIKQ